MRHLLTSISAFGLFLCSSCAQGAKPMPAAPSRTEVGGPFENQEFFFIGMPDRIGATDTCSSWWSGGQRLVVRGQILQLDGRTSAPGAVLYYYQTNAEGVYNNEGDLDRLVRRHGSLRGWVKSDEEGRYQICTTRPGPYPGLDQPAHIHPAILEPGISQPYYLDDFVFEGDPLLRTSYLDNVSNRGGSGVMQVVKVGGIEYAQHDIVLGLNVPGY